MDLKKIQQKLLQEKEKINKELSQFAIKNKNIKNDFDSQFPSWGDDVDSNAAEVETYSSRLGVERSLEKELSNIEEALRRIKNNTYGICADCGKKINSKRLEIMPQALYCITCQSKH